MRISESKKKIVIDNYFKRECDVNTSIKEAFTKGFELGLKKAPIPQQTEWIPVSERLPKDEQEVLITYKISAKHHVWSAIWDKLHGRFYDKEYRSYISLNYVVAWMPLPIPYKGVE